MNFEDDGTTAEEDRRRAVQRAFTIGIAVGAHRHGTALRLDAWRPPRVGRLGRTARLEASDTIVEAFRAFIDQAVEAGMEGALARLRESVHDYVTHGRQPSADVEAAYRLGYNAGRQHPDADVLPFRIASPHDRDGAGN